MSPSENEYEETIANLKQEKEDLEKQVSMLNERNRNQAMLLKRLDSARQTDRTEYEAQILELKEALSQERIKTRRAANFQNGPWSPSASQRSVMAPITSPRQTTQSEGDPRQVSLDDRKSWKDSTGSLTSSGSDRLGNTAQVQSALLGAAMKQKQRKQNKGGFWSLFGNDNHNEDTESESAKRDAAILKNNEESRTSILTKEIMQALEENKRVIVEREEELSAREEVQRVKEEAIRKNQQRRMSEKMSSSFGLLSFGSDNIDEDGDNVRAPTTPDQVNMMNISKLRDSDLLDVDTLRRLIADRTAGMKEEDMTDKTSIVVGREEKEDGSESEYDPEGDDELTAAAED
ncbi:unnamed protein product [Cylindrotheca closterium]|uniref:Uncharacterized protein n=1 Tax=Cylindrotheca closterium TaxID=2856 RepID=A0AAD2CRL4_9STRA|nr:unnamed protein product [Cylindrotheca closterium]